MNDVISDEVLKTLEEGLKPLRAARHWQGERQGPKKPSLRCFHRVSKRSSH